MVVGRIDQGIHYCILYVFLMYDLFAFNASIIWGMYRVSEIYQRYLLNVCAVIDAKFIFSV